MFRCSGNQIFILMDEDLIFQNPLLPIMKLNNDKAQTTNSSIRLREEFSTKMQSNHKQNPQELQFSDDFDAYLYKSKHIATPVLTPHLTFSFPSEESAVEPLEPPSTISPCTSEMNVRSNTKLTITDRQVYRRASHSGNPYSQSGACNNTSTSSFLDIPMPRYRGSSLPNSLSGSDIYRLRNFSTLGKKVVNEGDSYKTRTNSMSSACSRLE